MTTTKTAIAPLAGWLFGIIVFMIGLLNLFFVHLVPGNFFLLLSFLYFPPATAYFKERFGFVIPVVVKIVLAVLIIWFTLGVSDLGDMIDGKAD